VSRKARERSGEGAVDGDVGDDDAGGSAADVDGFDDGDGPF